MFFGKMQAITKLSLLKLIHGTDVSNNQGNASSRKSHIGAQCGGTCL
jgi:hypothetical protein